MMRHNLRYKFTFVLKFGWTVRRKSRRQMMPDTPTCCQNRIGSSTCHQNDVGYDKIVIKMTQDTSKCRQNRIGLANMSSK